MAELDRLGDRAIRFARPAASPRAIVRAVRAWPHAIDVVIAVDHVAVYFDREPVLDPALVAALAGLADDPTPVRSHELPARYDGDDLDDVARAIGGSTDDVRRLHAAASYTVETMGFAPGFAYLRGLAAPLVTIARRATPRPRVAAGSIAIAGGYTGVYPFDSPGGWRVLGSVVGVAMFDAAGPRLALGDHVRFVP